MRLRKETVNLLRGLTVVGFLLTTAYVFVNMPANPTAILYSPVFVQAIMLYVFEFFAYQILSNKTKFQIKIIERPRQLPPNQTELPFTPPKTLTFKEEPRKQEEPVPNNNIPKQIEDKVQSATNNVVFNYSMAVTPRAMNYIIVIIGLLMFAMLLIWSIDVSVSAINMSKAVDTLKIEVSNGVFSRNAATNYHICLVLLILDFILLAFVSLRLMLLRLPKEQRQRLRLPRPIKSRRLKTFALASQILAIPFMIMIMVQLFVASSSGTGFAIVYYDHFGEMLTEIVLFSIVAVIVIVGVLVSYKVWKEENKKKEVEEKCQN